MSQPLRVQICHTMRLLKHMLCINEPDGGWYKSVISLQGGRL